MMANYACGFPHVMHAPVAAGGAAIHAVFRYCRLHQSYDFPHKFTCVLSWGTYQCSAFSIIASMPPVHIATVIATHSLEKISSTYGWCTLTPKRWVLHSHRWVFNFGLCTGRLDYEKPYHSILLFCMRFLKKTRFPFTISLHYSYDPVHVDKIHFSPSQPKPQAIINKKNSIYY